MTLIARARATFLFKKLAFAMAAIVTGMFSTSVVSALPGLDGPSAIGPFLNGKLPALEPTGGSEWTVQRTFNGISINLPMHVAPYPGTNKLLCVAKEGRIFLFDNAPAASVLETFLDLRTQVFNNSDSGMTWLEFHPQFGAVGNVNRGFVYVTYKWKPPGGNGAEAYWRLSRFTVQDGNQFADPASELILIQQYDRQQFHDSGCMTFGGDGYLYIGIGDEGGANDEYNDGQKIDERLFSGILRIDVDQKAGSHAIRRQPTQLPMPAGWPDSFTANYKIPSDNPFNDATGGQLEEFYGIGLRQPYRFSYDALTDRMWVAESGQDTREELDILLPGANYGWPFREGKIARPTGPQPPVIPSPIIGTLTEPIWDVAHGIDNCTIGGFVYRGAAFPSLLGKYLTVDNVTSHIRAHTFDGTVATNELLTDMPSGSVYSGTSTIGKDQNGEPIFIKIDGSGPGSFYKLAAIPTSSVTRSGWYRFEDQDVTNTSGYVADNPGNQTANSVTRGVPLLAYDDESFASTNVIHVPGSGANPTGFPANTAGVRMRTGDPDGRPGNTNGDLITAAKLGVLDDFTAEISFRPNAGSLGNGYQAFLGLDGFSGTTPANDGEDGPALQPFRLMRWGRTDAGATLFPLTNGDLFLNIRSVNRATGQWTTVPLKVLSNTAFTSDQWYHLAIVGNVAAGTLKVHRYDPATSLYTEIAQATGYVGNIQTGTWTVGRGCYNNGAADWVYDASFDEFRITDQALPVSKFLYGTDPILPVIPILDPPALLSLTGAFSNLATLAPAPGVVPYGVNAPLWSDGAEKKRWMALPNDGLHNTAAEKIAFAPEGNWAFPSGTVFIKHFELPVDDNNPAIIRRLETRFVIVPTIGEPYGLTYKWRADGSEADLLPGGLNESISIATVGGGTRQQIWSYPSRSDCRICHNGNADYILGVKTNQLNGDFTYPLTGRTAGQLETLGSLGWFDSAYRSDLVPLMLKSHNVAESTASLTERVRSYLDSNCSQCHQPGGVRAYFDARYTTPLEEQGLINGELETSYGSPLNHVISPGDPAHSIMLLRMGSLAEIKMPPLAKHLVDQPAIQLLTDWINSLATGPSVALSTPSAPTGPFMVNVLFTQDVTGLTLSDFLITNGTATSLTGSAANYVLSITPAAFGAVTVKLPAAAVVNGAGIASYASSLFSQTVADQNFVAWLKLDDAIGSVAMDSSFSGVNSGTLVNMAPGDWISGRFGSALDFKASDERVTVPNMVGADFSISFWMKVSPSVIFPFTNTTSDGDSIFNADINGQARDFTIAGTRNSAGLNRVSFQTGRGNGISSDFLHGTSSVNTGQWIHVVITRAQTSGEAKIHVNSVLETSMIASKALLTQNPVISIGATPGNAARSFEGSLDDIRIFTRVLTPAEIVELGSGPPAEPPFDQWVENSFPGIYHLQSPSVDAEGDGLSNFAEFAYGTNPAKYDTIPVPLVRSPNGTVTVSYRARKAPAGATYAVKVSANMLLWTDAAPNITGITRQSIPATDYEWVHVTYVPPAGAGARQFFRIQAQPQ